MLSRMFGFQGRMTRLAYLGWSLGVCLIGLFGVMVVSLLTGAVGTLIGAGGLASIGSGILVFIAGFILLLWSTLALSAKRIRDMGFSPLIVMGGMFVFSLADALIAPLTDARFVWPFQNQTIIGGAVVVAYWAALLFWPSAGDERGFATA